MDARLNEIRRQFNRSAGGTYDANARVQRLMAEGLVMSFDRWRRDGGAAMPHILEIGCGTGLFTEMLLRNWPASSLTALDVAPAMLEAAEGRLRSGAASALHAEDDRSDRVRFLLADAESWAAEAPPAAFDLIVSNACFQWLRQPGQTLLHLRRLLRPGGLLAFTTFGPETFRELHQSFDEAYRVRGLAPHRHGLSFLPEAKWRLLLKESGFTSTKSERSVDIETHPSVREFLLSVKGVGANTSEAPGSGLGSRGLFAEMFKHYEAKFSIPGGIAATYELLTVHAF
jgi:malonyl-CoA O-methyltransferase